MSDNLLPILSLRIPDPPKPHIGFLEICRQAHRETVNSAIYATFLDPEFSPEIARLFLSALIELLEEHLPERLHIEDYQVHTEWGSSKGRIDIVIMDQTNNSVILIENKIYHILQNDLEDYWIAFDEKILHKQGVVLTLFPSEVKSSLKGRYVNLTHMDWIRQIEKKGLPVGLEPRHYQYLNDFFQTMKNLSKGNAMDEQIKFFFDHQSHMIRAQELYSSAQKFVMDQVSFIRNDPNWENYGNNSSWIHLWPAGQKEDIYYVLGFDKIYHPEKSGRPEMTIYIQIEGAAMQHDSALREIAKNRSDHSLYQFEGGGGNDHWKHFAFKRYELTPEQINNWVGFALNEIENVFSPFYNALRDYLSEQG